MKQNYVIVNNIDFSGVFSFLHADETAEQGIKRAEKFYEEDKRIYSSHLVNFPDNADYWQQCLSKVIDKLNAGFSVMTYEEFIDRQKEYFCSLPIEEVTEEQYQEMLNVLPPIYYTNCRGCVCFCMCEMYTGTFTNQYCYEPASGKYYTALVDVTDKNTWIPERLAKVSAI